MANSHQASREPTPPAPSRGAPTRAGLDVDPEQHGVGDMTPDNFRHYGRQVIDWVADYLADVGERRVLSDVAPGAIRHQLPTEPPIAPEAFATVLRDFDTTILPGITHWNHPAFHGYFAITGSGPGILAETLIAALNVNGMLWRTSPSATELEETVVDWVRHMLALPNDWRGLITDSASISTLTALAAAREQADLGIRELGMAGRHDLPRLTVYASDQAHSSIEKAAITLGLGRQAMRFIPSDHNFCLDPDALERQISNDLSDGRRPLAIVATVGSTSTTSVDPVAAIANVRDTIVEETGHPVWLHVDGAYGAMAAIHPDQRWLLDGVDRADSMVTNPHKWLFTPIDASLLFVRNPAALINAFALSAEYLTTDDIGVTDFMDWGVQLGRRFRALKLWSVIRYFGSDGLARRIDHHLEQAHTVAAWVEQHPDLALAAPAPLSTVCFRAAPAGLTDDEHDALNQQLLRRLNDDGRIFLSHTILRGRYVLRLALGNLRTTDERLAQSLQLIADTLSAIHAEHRH